MRFTTWVAALAAAALACALPSLSTAQKISSFPAASALSGTDGIAGIQGSGCSTASSPCANVLVTPAQIATYVATATPLTSAFQPLDGDLTSLGSAGAVGSLYYRSATSTWSPVTIGSGLGFSGGTLALTAPVPVSQGGTGSTSASAARSALGLAIGADVQAYSGSSSPPLPSGRWTVGEGSGLTIGTPTAPGANVMRLYPIRIRRSITVTDLAVRVTTASASGNVQIAVYAADPSSLAPTGAPIYSSTSISTTSTASAAAISGLTVALPSGIYWVGTNSDNATANYVSISTSQTSIDSLIGASTALNALTSAGNLVGITKTQTYGSWPTLTGSYSADGEVEYLFSAMPLVALKVQ